MFYSVGVEVNSSQLLPAFSGFFVRKPNKFLVCKKPGKAIPIGKRNQKEKGGKFMLTGAPLIAVFLVTMVILFVLLIKFKFSATIALVLASMILALPAACP